MAFHLSIALSSKQHMNRDVLRAEMVSQNLYMSGAFAEQKAVSAVFDASYYILDDQTVAQIILRDLIIILTKGFLCSENTSGGVLSSIRSEYVMIR